jgi:hypothetical protein
MRSRTYCHNNKTKVIRNNKAQRTFVVHNYIEVGSTDIKLLSLPTLVKHHATKTNVMRLSSLIERPLQAETMRQ